MTKELKLICTNTVEKYANDAFRICIGTDDAGRMVKVFVRKIEYIEPSHPDYDQLIRQSDGEVAELLKKELFI